MRRRDQRSGDARASATAVAGGVVCRAAWDAPFAGSLEESYTHPPGQPDVLNVRSTIRVGAKEATTLQVGMQPQSDDRTLDVRCPILPCSLLFTLWRASAVHRPSSRPSRCHRQVYHRRRGMSARDLISASEQRNGRAPDILRRFGMQAP